MFSCMLSLVKLKLCRVVHQRSVSNRRVVYGVCVQDVQIRVSHSDMHTKLEDISHDIYQKTQQNKTPNRHSQNTIS